VNEGARRKYFQFPLCLLAMADDEKTLLNRIISFAVVEAGRVLWQKKSSAQRKSLADDLRDCTASDFKRNDREHVAAALGARELNVTLGSIRGTVSTWRQVCDFRNSFESLHGREPELRILSGLAFEVRDGKGMSYREFAILCGMLSQIGDKKYPVRITREQIQRRMLGYRKEEIMRSELSKRTDGASPLSTRQIGYTVDKLHERRFFARARANERQTYYSIRHTQCELEAALIESKTYSQTFHAARRQKDVDFMARMKAAKAAIKVDTAIKVNNPPCSNHVHVASAGVCAGASAAVSAGVSTLIETPRIETLPKETYSIETLSTQTRANKPGKLQGPCRKKHGSYSTINPTACPSGYVHPSKVWNFTAASAAPNFTKARARATSAACPSAPQAK